MIMMTSQVSKFFDSLKHKILNILNMKNYFIYKKENHSWYFKYFILKKSFKLWSEQLDE